MRIVGVRVSPPAVRLLVQMLDDAGYPATAVTLRQAIELQALEPALTLEDCEAMLLALGDTCPTSLARLRRELLEIERRRRLAGA
jgi:hypothetical protein